VTCQIVDRERKRDSDDDEWLHYLSYRAIVNGQETTQRELVDSDSYENAPLGSTARLQISPLLPGFDSVLLLPGRKVWGVVWGTGFGSLVMLAMVALMVWHIYILPTRGRHLAIWGEAVMGRLIDKTQAVDSEAQGYYFHYEYRPLAPDAAFDTGKVAAPQPLLGRQRVRDSDWDTPQIGGFYTVLYDPRKPHSSVLYLYGDYEAAG
jgi:hypothetical protein